jgi:hypothetical protein
MNTKHDPAAPILSTRNERSMSAIDRLQTTLMRAGARRAMQGSSMQQFTRNCPAGRGSLLIPVRAARPGPRPSKRRIKVNTNHNTKKRLANLALGAAAVAMMAPAALLAGAGTANASLTEVDFAPWAPGTGNLTVNIANNTPQDFGQCQYVSTATLPSLLPPFKSDYFPVGPWSSRQLSIGNYFGPDAIPTGTIWNIAVNCSNGSFPVNVDGGNGTTFQF